MFNALLARFPRACFRNHLPDAGYGSDVANCANASSDQPLIDGSSAGHYGGLTWHYVNYPGNLTHSSSFGDQLIPIGAQMRRPDGGDDFVLFTINDTVETLVALFLRKSVVEAEARVIAADIIGFYSEVRIYLSANPSTTLSSLI